MIQESFGRTMLAVCGMITAYEPTVVIVTLNKRFKWRNRGNTGYDVSLLNVISVIDFGDLFYRALKRLPEAESMLKEALR